MDNYPNVKVSTRECASRQSTSTSATHTSQPNSSHKHAHDQQPPRHHHSDTAPYYEGQHAPPLRRDSASPSPENTVVAAYARYTDAPPPYAASQYEGKTEEQQNKMRMADYAKEIKRAMGRQLVRGLKNGETKAN
ncbi:hypothetical protein ACEQ8H_004559 [Pleosporales sp. CAS-2024a]